MRVIGRNVYNALSNNGKNYCQQLADYVSDVVDENGIIVGRAAILTRKRYVSGDMPIYARGIITVGGQHTHTFSSVVGVFMGKNIGAARSKATLTASGSTLKKWVKEQLENFSMDNTSIEGQLEYARTTWNMGYALGKLPIVKMGNRFFNYEQLVQFFKDLVSPAVVYVIDQGSIEHSEDQFIGVFKPIKNLFELNQSSTVLLSTERGIDMWPARDKVGNHFYNSLLGAFGKALSEAWGIDQDKMLSFIEDSAVSRKKTHIGFIADVPFHQEVLVIEREALMAYEEEED